MAPMRRPAPRLGSVFRVWCTILKPGLLVLLLLMATTSYVQGQGAFSEEQQLPDASPVTGTLEDAVTSLVTPAPALSPTPGGGAFQQGNEKDAASTDRSAWLATAPAPDLGEGFTEEELLAAEEAALQQTPPFAPAPAEAEEEIDFSGILGARTGTTEMEPVPSEWVEAKGEPGGAVKQEGAGSDVGDPLEGVQALPDPTSPRGGKARATPQGEDDEPESSTAAAGGAGLAVKEEEPQNQPGTLPQQEMEAIPVPTDNPFEEPSSPVVEQPSIAGAAEEDPALAVESNPLTQGASSTPSEDPLANYKFPEEDQTPKEAPKRHDDTPSDTTLRAAQGSAQEPSLENRQGAFETAGQGAANDKAALDEDVSGERERPQASSRHSGAGWVMSAMEGLLVFAVSGAIVYGASRISERWRRFQGRGWRQLPDIEMSSWGMAGENTESLIR
eukprot:TRINITY_DN2166_c0_g1_i1.p1 TRINITY_DN2166_c0_g1~~TRINITY_DN2166_c0_g1_i1.p1  ORF type:complete len:445 (-),score=79.45 TRINITY_DN2166_c0_g1_i1:227-1561(-)